MRRWDERVFRTRTKIWPVPQTYFKHCLTRSQGGSKGGAAPSRCLVTPPSLRTPVLGRNECCKATTQKTGSKTMLLITDKIYKLIEVKSFYMLLSTSAFCSNLGRLSTIGFYVKHDYGFYGALKVCWVGIGIDFQFCLSTG